MKLRFNIGMRFIFGYAKEATSSGPTYPWQITEEINDYLNILHVYKLLKRGRKYDTYNVGIYKKLNEIKKL
jgi:hypothetical protein